MPVYELFEVVLEERGRMERLCELSEHEAGALLKANARLSRPTHFAFCRDNHQAILVVPRPDKRYRIHVQASQIVSF